MLGSCFKATSNKEAFALIEAEWAKCSILNASPETPIASLSDNRSYRALRLMNGIKVLLISDPTTSKSAAALDVLCGSFQDPKDIPGLAHFLEHMLFLGTEKYPDENAYSAFVTGHGGSSNAFTSTTHTNYYFDISPQHLLEGLDLFAQFFISPLFDQNCTERELNAVDSEHDKNVKQDAWRKQQIERSLSSPLSPFNHFSTGNKSTLAKDFVRERLIEFYKTHYSSHLMSLCVLGGESLDELQKVVSDMFEAVPCSHIPAPDHVQTPITEKELGVLVKMVPVKEINSLEISFCIPDPTFDYKSQSAHYLSHLYGHEGTGSLLSYLKNKGLGDALASGARSIAPGNFGFLRITIDLTREGVERYEEVIEAFFEYTAMLRAHGPQQWIFDECRVYEEMTFRYLERRPPSSYACALASSLHHHPPKLVLNAPYLMETFRPDLINELLSYITPSNASVMLVSPSCVSDCPLVEPWYGTCYGVSSIASESIKKWESVVPNESNMHLPLKNHFLPSRFDIVPPTAEGSLPDSYPLLVDLASSSATPLSKLWFKQDVTFNLPKANVSCSLVSPYSYLDPLCANLSRLVIDLIKESLAEYSYLAQLGGLSYMINPTTVGLQIDVWGYTDKLTTLLDVIMARCVDPFSKMADGNQPRGQSLETRFNDIKDVYRRSLTNFPASQPNAVVAYTTKYLLADKLFPHAQRLDFLDEITLEQVKNFIPMMFSRVSLEWLVHGNYSQQEAIVLVQNAEKALSSGGFKLRPLFDDELVGPRTLLLPDRTAFCYEVSNDLNHMNSIEIYFQMGSFSAEMNARTAMFLQLTSESVFNTLRTKEQLGYIVGAACNSLNGVVGYRIVVQGEGSPYVLHDRAEAYLAALQDELSTMTDEEFATHVSALCSKLLDKPKNLLEETNRYWNEIVAGTYRFNKYVEEEKIVRALTKQDMIEFYEMRIKEGAPQRKKLLVYFIAAKTKTALGEKEARNCEPIANVSFFKKSLPLSSRCSALSSKL